MKHAEGNVIFGNTELKFSINFKALLILVEEKKIFCCLKTQRRGIIDVRGKCTNLLYFFPLSLQSFVVGSRDRTQETVSYHLNG